MELGFLIEQYRPTADHLIGEWYNKDREETLKYEQGAYSIRSAMEEWTDGFPSE